MSDTPKTDANCGWPVGHRGRIECSDLKWSPDGPFVHSDVARHLERENATLRKALDKAIVLLRRWNRNDVSDDVVIDTRKVICAVLKEAQP